MFTTLLTLGLGLAPAWAQDAEMAISETAALVSLGERASAEGQLRAREHVLGRLDALGLSPRCLGLAPGLDACFVCVGELKAGALWSLSHLDAVRQAPGAIDNAAAVGVNLAAAAALRGEALPQPACFAFPEGEEVGLLGAENLQAALAAKGLTPGLVLSMDLVGHGTLTANGLGPRWGDDSLRWLMRTLGEPTVSSPFVYRAMSRAFPGMERSDHRPFTQAGVRAFHLMGRGPEGIYWRYHTPQDAMDQVEPGAMARTLDAVVRLARATLPGADGGEPTFSVGLMGWVAPGVSVFGALALGAVVGLGGIWGRWWVTGLGLLRGALRAVALGVLWSVAVALSAFGAPTLGELAEPCAVAALALGALWLTRGRVAGPAFEGGGAAAGGILCVGLLGLLARFDPLLALPYGLAALGLGLAARGGHPGLTALLTLPGPLYLTSGDVWRELRFHHLLHDTPTHLALFVAAIWLPIACWSVDWAPASRRQRLVLLGAFGIALVWAWLTPAFSTALPELSPR
jgi:hypothetical protein